MKYVYLFIITLFTLLASCKQRVYLTVNEPPIVHLGSEYTRAGFINRSFSGGKSKTLETIDNAFSLEGNLDLKGSNAAIRGAYDRLTTNQRFEYLALMDSLTVENGGIGVFPAALTWNEVDEQCKLGNVQFLMVLEVYDTDTKISYSTGMTTKQTPLGSVQVPVHNATMTTIIKTGWRIYDPNRKLIIDEIYLTDRLVSNGSGINPVAAAATLLNREQAVKQISTRIGESYAHRIEPQLFRVWRNYYNKGSQNLRIAKRRSEVGDWDGAAEMWQKDLDSPKRKVAGRATYNMAIYKEIVGDIDGALELAQKAYSDYRIKEGQIYANILRDRIARREREKVLSGQ
jgi:hypothetical protein